MTPPLTSPSAAGAATDPAAATNASGKPAFTARIARRLVLGRLAELQRGRLVVREAWGGETLPLGSGRSDELQATLNVRDPSFYTQLALGGSVGAAESYMDGGWESDDLVALMRLMVLNRGVLDAMEGGLARFAAGAARLLYRVQANTRRGSRRNIAAHYDLGNAFFSQFLDDTLTYSAGIFEHPQATMAEASRAKLDRLCRKLALTADDHLLEIGTGWGSMALHAAREYGCRVTTATISREQHREATERVRAAGLSDRVTILLQDYRDLQGSFDKLVSVEMIEAVGHQYLDTYLETCSRLLKPDGVMALQVITMQDQHYSQALGEVDFIKRHVFPGSFIPSITAILDAATRSTDLKLFQMEDMTPHYVRTLQLWRERFLRNREAIAELGYDERFLRMWEYYLCYCEGGFAERLTGSAQLVLTRPDCRQAPVLPPLPRADVTDSVRAAVDQAPSHAA